MDAMNEEHLRKQGATAVQAGRLAYEPPRIEKGRRLGEVTGAAIAGGGGVVPSGAPAPQAA